MPLGNTWMVRHWKTQTLARIRLHWLSASWEHPKAGKLEPPSSRPRNANKSQEKPLEQDGASLTACFPNLHLEVEELGCFRYEHQLWDFVVMLTVMRNERYGMPNGCCGYPQIIIRDRLSDFRELGL